MHQEVIRIPGSRVALLTMIAMAVAVLNAPAYSQTGQSEEELKAAKAQFMRLQNDAIRTVALDPCNAAGKIPALVRGLVEPGARARVGTDGLDFSLNNLAKRGCENLNKKLPPSELLFIAALNGYLDPCTYSPDKDYSVQMTMARASFSEEFYTFDSRDLHWKPCLREFIVARLTGKAVVRPAATEQKPATETVSPTRRRGR